MSKTTALRQRVRADVRTRLADERGISVADRDRLVEEITDDTLGYGPLEKLLADETVTEIMVNGPDDVWIERQGRLYETHIRFTDDAHLRRIINKIVGTGRPARGRSRRRWSTPAFPTAAASTRSSRRCLSPGRWSRSASSPSAAGISAISCGWTR